MASFDAYVFVTPEYHHSTSGVLKNTVDLLYAEWNDKVAGSSAMAWPMAAAPQSTCA
jgi:NAD(P)H-dependent FMN reductase